MRPPSVRYLAFFAPLVMVAFFLSIRQPEKGDGYLTPVKTFDVGLIKGITVVAPPQEIGSAAFEHIKKINTSWVCFVPYGFIKQGHSQVLYGSQWQWWGEKKEGVLTCILEAKKQGLKVMLKPQIFIPNGWTGSLDFESEEDWNRWETSYRTYILDFATLAAQQQVEMFCIGTEFDKTTVKRQKYWQKLIAEVRNIYPGVVTYSANWDSFEKIPFWKHLDVIGISGYFPLDDETNPEVSLLITKWRPVVKKLADYSHKHGRKILFTEYGYMSVDGCAGKVWEIEKNKDKLNINHKAQSHSFEALWQSFSGQEFWAGGFVWKWFPDGMGHEGYPEKDYTPQGKPAEKVLAQWFSK